MKTVADFPYFEVEFTRDGGVGDATDVSALQEFIAQGRTSDLIAIAHGWNNDMAAARDLYARFLACVRAVLDRHVVPPDAGRSFAVMAVLWPSITFADEDLIPTGPAMLGNVVSISFVEQQLAHLENALQAPEKALSLKRARALVPELQGSRKAQAQFADLVRSVLPATDVEVDDASGAFFSRSGHDLMDRLAGPTPRPQAARGVAVSGRAGVSAGAGGAAADRTLEGPLSAARNLLNYSTYYLMKERAGTVGRRGVNSVLRQLKAIDPGLRIHLIGHSFGARLMAAAADGPLGQAAVPFDTLLLLQAAFSHNAFAEKFDGARDGAFRGVVTEHKSRGPILVTYTVNDRAVGIAYPLASRVAGQDSSRLGDAGDLFGGLGRNGAQHTPEGVAGTLLPVSGRYTFTPGKIYNLNSDAVIHDHSDICHDEVAFAFLTAVAEES